MDDRKISSFIFLTSIFLSSLLCLKADESESKAKASCRQKNGEQKNFNPYLSASMFLPFFFSFKANNRNKSKSFLKAER